jgi:hypothetical protein
MPVLHGVHHLALTIADIDRSVAWYVRVLGFEEFARRDEPQNGLRKAVLRAPVALRSRWCSTTLDAENGSTSEQPGWITSRFSPSRTTNCTSGNAGWLSTELTTVRRLRR